jgi:hypothetical protein
MQVRRREVRIRPVIFPVLCPSSSYTLRRLAPRMTRWLAKVWRRS